jgi:hypothetical protein
VGETFLQEGEIEWEKARDFLMKGWQNTKYSRMVYFPCKCEFVIEQDL